MSETVSNYDLRPKLGHLAGVAPALVRPANTTAYAVGQALAQSTIVGSCSPIAVPAVDLFNAINHPIQGATVQRVHIRKSGTGVTNAIFRVHFFNRAPTGFVADAVAFTANNAGYLGAVDVTVSQVFIDGSYGVGLPNVGTSITGMPADGKNLFFLLEVRGIYTPASAESFTVEVEYVR